MTIRVKNWGEFQHYKGRTPPWIKLYRRLLDDPEWFALSGDASKMLANCWLLASERDGTLPEIKTIAFRLRMTPDAVKELIAQLGHWLDDDASGLLAPCKQDACPETETETDKNIVQISNLNESKVRRNSRKDKELDPLYLEFYSAYPRHQSKKAGAKAYASARKSGVSHEAIMRGLDRAKRMDSRFRDPRYTPLPASWLNAGGFEDEPNSQSQDWKSAVFQ